MTSNTPTTIRGVEIFKAGTWNNDTYTTRDLDEMVANFGRVGFQVPVTLGHTKETGAPAYGWVENIRRVGDKLVADFKDLDGALIKAIKERRFDAVSAEVFFNLKRSGRVFRRVLKAVALLGAETPAVSGLAPLRSVVNTIADCDRSPAYEFSLKTEDDMHHVQTESTSPSAEIDRLAREYVFANPTVTYPVAVDLIMSQRPELVAAYGQETRGRVRSYAAKGTTDDPAAALDHAAQALMDAGEAKTYSEAARKAILENPDLGQKWARTVYPGGPVQ